MRTLEQLTVASVGYEGRTASELVDVVREAGITLLVDVRLTPLSRKPGLSKTKLASALHQSGVDYLHLPTLGNPRDNREAYRQSDARALDRFRMLVRASAARPALDQLAERVSEESVALLCFERDHSACHRSLVIEALQERHAALTVERI